jgi:hypothetical protein
MLHHAEHSVIAACIENGLAFFFEFPKCGLEWDLCAGQEDSGLTVSDRIFSEQATSLTMRRRDSLRKLCMRCRHWWPLTPGILLEEQAKIRILSAFLCSTRLINNENLAAATHEYLDLIWSAVMLSCTSVGAHTNAIGEVSKS